VLADCYEKMLTSLVNSILLYCIVFILLVFFEIYSTMNTFSVSAFSMKSLHAEYDADDQVQAQYHVEYQDNIRIQ